MSTRPTWDDARLAERTAELEQECTRSRRLLALLRTIVDAASLDEENDELYHVPARPIQEALNYVVEQEVAADRALDAVITEERERLGLDEEADA